MAPRDNHDHPPEDTATPAAPAEDKTDQPAKPSGSVPAARDATSEPANPDAAKAATPDTVAAASTAPATPAAPVARHGRRLVLRRVMMGVIALLGPLAALALGLYIYLAGGRYMVTDNAYVKSAKIAVSSDVTGRVVAVFVGENKTVQPGDVLFQVDPEPFRIALAEAEAGVLAARQDVEALRAAYHRNVAAFERARADIAYHQEQVARQAGLSNKRLISDSSFDAAKRALRNAQDDVKVAEQARAEALAKLAGNPAIAVDDHPAVRAAVAARDRAALNLARTAVKATVTGIVTNFDLQPGEYVEAGNVVFSLVDARDIWIHANYKETELTHVRVGQPATVAVDTYPGHVFAGRVAGISPATGAEFALLPPQNATGNWVKVVQRLTVRIRLDEPATALTADAPGAEPPPRLRAGMSAHVEIDTGHQRRLSAFIGPLGNWISPVAEARP